MSEKLEGDLMACRACGRDARASEGYPCRDCGTFVCIRCNFRGIELCKSCQQKAKAASAPTGAAR